MELLRVILVCWFYLLMIVFAIIMINVAIKQNKLLNKELKEWKYKELHFITGERGYGKKYCEEHKHNAKN